MHLPPTHHICPWQYSFSARPPPPAGEEPRAGSQPGKVFSAWKICQYFGLLKLGKYTIDVNSCDLGHLSGSSEMNNMGHIGQEYYKIVTFRANFSNYIICYFSLFCYCHHCWAFPLTTIIASPTIQAMTRSTNITLQVSPLVSSPAKTLVNPSRAFLTLAKQSFFLTLELLSITFSHYHHSLYLSHTGPSAPFCPLYSREWTVPSAPLPHPLPGQYPFPWLWNMKQFTLLYN